MRRILTAFMFVQAALAIESCGSDGGGPCATEGAVRVHGLCECPEGTYHDPKVDQCRAIPGFEPRDAASGDAGAPFGDATVGMDGDAETSKRDDATPMTPDHQPSEPQQGSDIPTADAGEEVAADASTPATDASAAPDAPQSQPMKPPADGCVAREETCNGKDDDCDGMVDEGVLPYWYRDCDGDDYAANAVGRVESCTRPPTTAECKGWTKRVPEGKGAVDCDDTTALRFPGADFGIAPPSSGDLNCDGKVEVKYEVLLSSTIHAPGAQDGNFKVCTTYKDCNCYTRVLRFRGYKGFDSDFMPVAEAAIPLWTDPDALRQPCAYAAGDALSLSWSAASDMPSDPNDCQSGTPPSGEPPFLVVRDLCR